AVFEGSCKMLQMATAADKARKEIKETKVEEKPLDTSKMPTMRADAAKATEIPAVSNVVS
ncbi:MAG TPA: hypothetical protein VFP64_07970, partial [Pyrinomonadaceae bacterium]|nr:hypothetical protein [Pyrinomonadaceae bacterium]